MTATGEALWWELNGTPVLPIHPERPPHKMISRGGSLMGPVTAPAVLYAWLVRNLERLIEELEYNEVRAGAIAVWVGYKDGREGSGRSVLEAPSDRFDALLDHARGCLRGAWIPKVPATRMQIFAERLAPRSMTQLGLFAPPTGRDNALAKLKREANEKIGRFALRSGATLPLQQVYDDQVNGYDICDIRGKICF